MKRAGVEGFGHPFWGNTIEDLSNKMNKTMVGRAKHTGSSGVREPVLEQIEQ